MTSCLQDISPTRPSLDPLNDAASMRLVVYTPSDVEACAHRSESIPAALLTWVPREYVDIYCGPITLARECVPYAAEWRGADGLTAPALAMRWLPEPDALVAGLVLLALVARGRQRWM